MQCEATFVNKMAKIRQETEAAIHEVSFQVGFQYVCIFRLLLVHCAANGLFFQANTRLKQAERDRAEVLHLQNTFRLSWVPDEVRIDLWTVLRYWGLLRTNTINCLLKVFQYSFSKTIPIFFRRLKKDFILVRSL